MQVNSMCRKCAVKVIKKEQVEDLYVSLRLPHPHFLIPFEGELRKVRGSRGRRRWFLSEAGSREL